jgi:hypothetical protein
MQTVLELQIRFLDLEAGIRVGVDHPTNLFTYGFRDPRRVIKGEQTYRDDLYTLGTLMTYMMFPITAMGNLRKDVYGGLAHKLARDLRWPSAIPALIGRLIDGGASYDDVRVVLERSIRLRGPASTGTMTPAEIEKAVGELAAFMRKSMQIGEYQLCPGDPFVFATNPLGLSSGAIGVLYALKKCKCDIPSIAWEYLDAKLSSVDLVNYPPGLLTGLGGIAWGTWELGRESEAIRLIRLANVHPLLKTHHSLFYGMAGVGLTNLYFYLRTGQGDFLDHAEHLAKELLATALQDGADIFWQIDGKTHVGLGYGQAGVALFLLRLSQITGNPKWREVGRQALNYDYRCGREIQSGILSFPGKPGAMTLEPYLEEGTAGMVKVLLRYGMVEEAIPLSADLCRKHCVSASYLFGLGGIVDSLVDLHVWTGDDKYLHLAQRPLSGIKDLYMIKTRRGLATPGDSGMAISCDFGTGGAGVMRVLHRYLTQDESDFTLDELDLERRRSV